MIVATLSCRVVHWLPCATGFGALRVIFLPWLTNPPVQLKMRQKSCGAVFVIYLMALLHPVAAILSTKKCRRVARRQQRVECLLHPLYPRQAL